MEFTEVVSAHVAFPVLGVLVCAVLVFAFGFKSPVQPPSFDFDDERNKSQRRNKKSKSKPQINGHVIAVVTEEASKPNFPKPKSAPKTTKQDSKSSKAENTTPKADSKKDKTKRGTKEYAKAKDEKPAASAKTKMMLEDDGEWEVQRSRKDKKQKPKEECGKKSDSNDDKNKPSSDEGEGSYAAAESKTRRKKKASKETPKTEQAEEVTIEPNQEEDMNAVASAISASKPVELAIAKVETKPQQAVSEEFETAQIKKNKKKKDKKPSTQDTPDGFASFISEQHESTPTALAPATAVVHTPAPASQTTKASVKEEPSIEADAKPARSPKKKKGKDSGANATAASQLQASKATTEEVEVVAEAKPAEPNKLTDTSKAKKTTERVKCAVSEPAQPEVVGLALAQAPKASEAASTPVTFDELGGSSDSWTEAPKSKKKRPRREN